MRLTPCRSALTLSEVVDNPAFDLKRMDAKLLRDVLLNVRRLLVKNYIEGATFRKAVGLLRVGSIVELAKHELDVR